MPRGIRRRPRRTRKRCAAKLVGVFRQNSLFSGCRFSRHLGHELPITRRREMKTTPAALVRPSTTAWSAFETLEPRRLLSGAGAANHQVLLAHGGVAHGPSQIVVAPPKAPASSGVTITAAPGVAFSGIIARVTSLRGIAAVSV